MTARRWLVTGVLGAGSCQLTRVTVAADTAAWAALAAAAAHPGFRAIAVRRDRWWRR